MKRIKLHPFILGIEGWKAVLKELLIHATVIRIEYFRPIAVVSLIYLGPNCGNIQYGVTNESYSFQFGDDFG
jgi:hypothetical protein